MSSSNSLRDGATAGGGAVRAGGGAAPNDRSASPVDLRGGRVGHGVRGVRGGRGGHGVRRKWSASS